MKRTLFLLILGVMPLRAWAIDIYVNGHKYDSIDAYKDSKKINHLAPALLNKDEENDVLKEAKRLGVKVDLSKMKTFQVASNAADSHRLYVLSIEKGFAGALQDFYKNRSLITDFKVSDEISSQELQHAIQQAVSSSQDPKLLIAQSGKVRIMSLAQDKQE